MVTLVLSIDALLCVDPSGNAHCGFVESAMEKNMAILTSRGYHVVRGDQTQLPCDMKKGQKVVNREVKYVCTCSLEVVLLAGG